MESQHDATTLDRAWTEYSDEFRRHVLPALLSSACGVTIFSADDDVTHAIRAATEIGFVLLSDQPLLLIVLRGSTAPAKLRAAATVVVEDVDMHEPASQARIVTAIRVIDATRE
jgi:hypothetical protein